MPEWTRSPALAPAPEVQHLLILAALGNARAPGTRLLLAATFRAGDSEGARADAGWGIENPELSQAQFL